MSDLKEIAQQTQLAAQKLAILSINDRNKALSVIASALEKKSKSDY